MHSFLLLFCFVRAICVAQVTCPISLDLATEAVCSVEGHTYDRTALSEWLSRNPRSPLTNLPLRPQTVHAVESFSLRNVARLLREADARADPAAGVGSGAAAGAL
jgi:hypothetical protein